MEKQILLTALTLALLASAVMTATAEEVVGTILFEPKRNGDGWEYSLSTNPESRIADKKILINFGNVGYAILTLPDYLVKGAKIVYENGAWTSSGITLEPPMRNTMGEGIHANRMIAIFTEDGIRIGIEELFPDTWAWYFPYLYNKLEREGRYR
jgi:hypothetical protein